MGWFDFIQRNQNLKEQQPVIELLQYDNNGNIDYNKILEAKQNTLPRKLSEHLLGRELTMDEQKINPKTNETELVTYRNFKPGFLNNFDAGLNENYYNDFAVNNLAPNANKTFATRLGEGLGSIAKILGTVGGDAYVAGTEGLDAAMKRQSYRTGDQLYRNALEAQNIDTSNIKGFIAPETFNRLIQAKQLQDNAKFRELYYKNQEQNQKDMMDFRQRQLEHQQKQDAFDNYIKSEKLKADKENKGTVNFNQITTVRKEIANIPAIKNNNEIKRQYDNVTNVYNAYKAGKLKANAADQAMITTLNKILDPTSVVRESEFARTAAGQSLLARIEGYANKITKGGGGLTNAEREDLYTAMQEMYNANQAEASAYIESYTDFANRYGINPADIMPRQYYQPIQTQSTTNNDPLGIRG